MINRDHFSEVSKEEVFRMHSSLTGQLFGYTPIQINRANLTIMGVPFPDLATLNSAANAIGSNMFEGFVPTAKSIQIIRNYLIGDITLKQFMQMARDKAYE